MGILKEYFTPSKPHDDATTQPPPAGDIDDGLQDSASSPQISLGQPSTPRGSRPASLSPLAGSESDELSDLKCEVMVSWLHQEQLEKLWYEGSDEEGIVLKKSKGVYACCPESLSEEPEGLRRAIEMLNVRVSDTPLPLKHHVDHVSLL